MEHGTLNMRQLQFGGIFLLALSFLLQNASAAMLKMAGIECELLGNSKSFMNVETCRLKAIRRDYSELSVKMNFYQLPIRNITGSMQLWRRANGFKPFLYNIKLDFCKLLKNTNYPNSFEKLLLDIFLKNSSIKRFSCPWNKSHIAFEKFGLTHERFRLPLPSDTYRIDIKLNLNGVDRFLSKLIIVVVE